MFAGSLPMARHQSFIVSLLLVCVWLGSTAAAQERVRLIVETDAGGDPDDEQSLVRLLVYANEFDIEGIIANRKHARDGENLNPVRDGLGIVRAMIEAYGVCYPNLSQHAEGYPRPEELLKRTVAGYDDVEDGVELIIKAVDREDSRPVWFSNWGTDHGSAESCLKRALDKVLRERGPQGYAKFKSRIHLSSADEFGDHIAKIEPSFPIWVEASQPELGGKRWYHRFSALTAKAGGFDIERDVRQGHGPLGAMYPLNTSYPQKEGDTMYFLYLLPTGMNDPMQPTWGSWGGRYGPHDQHPGKPYYWANQRDDWNGKVDRDNTVARWAVALQHDFAARMDWCVAKNFEDANHPPKVILNQDTSPNILKVEIAAGETIELSAEGTSDPDGDQITLRWFVYPETGTFAGKLVIDDDSNTVLRFVAPEVQETAAIHVILEAVDHGTPSLAAYRRAVIKVVPK